MRMCYAAAHEAPHEAAHETHDGTAYEDHVVAPCDLLQGLFLFIVKHFCHEYIT